MAKQNILNLSFQELEEQLVNTGEKPFRAKQIWQWIYQRDARNFNDMSNISKDFRTKLEEIFEIPSPNISKDLKSTDGTRKWLFKLHDDNEIETVFIPEKERGTLCISSQVGCTLTCTFCHTGTQRLVRNLDANEIVEQFIFAQDLLNKDASNTQDEYSNKITNIVMMGMGEPLLNFDNVSRAINIFLEDKGLNFSKRKITLSTSGIVPAIYQCDHEIGVNLAVSLHATNDKLRDEIVPINKKYNIDELLEACKNYTSKGTFRKITFEYVMLKDINDSNEHAIQLYSLIKDLPAKVNIIPFNPWPGSLYECSDEKRIKEFAKILLNKKINCSVRKPRGQDILAACGQLKSASIKERNSKIK